MGKAKKTTGRDEAWMREHGFTLDAYGKMIPEVNHPDGWRELAFAPIPKGMLALVPRRPKEGIQVADVPDCSIPLPSVKAELLRFMNEADIRTPEAAAKWRAVYEAAHMDEYLLEGISDELSRLVAVRVLLHLLVRFSRFVKASEGKMGREDALRQLDSRLATIEERLIRRIAPPVDQVWWKNLLNRYEDEPRESEAKTWLAVARIVVMGAINERGKPPRERRSDYLTPRMLNGLIDELKTGGRTDIEQRLAARLSRSVRRERQNEAKLQ